MVVRKTDFNENPVVSLDLDLDFDLGFVKKSFKSRYIWEKWYMIYILFSL